jgi:hypothetical protein
MRRSATFGWHGFPGTNLRQEINDQFRKIRQKLHTVTKTEDKTESAQIIAELHTMNEQIFQTKQKISGLKPSEGHNSTLSVATMELSEVGKATEDAPIRSWKMQKILTKLWPK